MTTSTTTTDDPIDATSRSADRPLVLIADDDPIHRLALARILERDGYDVVQAEDGRGAIALADAHDIDLVVVDVVMPGMTGLEVIAAIRSRPRLATIPAIIVSGLDDVESRVTAFSMGADDFVLKPFDPRELRARIGAQLRIVRAWGDRVGSVLDDHRAIRSRVAAAATGNTLPEAARSVLRGLPDELGCVRMVCVDRAGRCEWSSDPADPSRFDAHDLSVVPLGPGSTVLPTSDRAGCVLCGCPEGGSVLAYDAGTAGDERVLLLLGCLRRADTNLRATAAEVAETCRVVLPGIVPTGSRDPSLDIWLAEVTTERAFDFVYQPIVDLKSGRVVGQEALARFDDGTSPGEVFGAAEAHDRLSELELALVETALEKTNALPETIRLHVNVSPTTALTDELRELMSRTSRRVVLEITENALFSSSSASALRGSIPASCLLAADDVGAGYAGMSQLLEFRPDILKIDRAVVAGIDRDPARRALAAGLVLYAQATRSFVVGEGIERQEEWDALSELGVDFGQGYLIARPSPLHAVTDLLSVERPG